MAIIVCDCSAGPSNTGKPDCPTVPGVGKKDIIVPLKANDGEKNRIDLENDTLDETYFIARYNETDASKRWYPIASMKSLTDVREDPTSETFEDGSSIFIEEGARNNSYMIPNCWGTYLKKLQSFNCGKNGYFRVDKQGNLQGKLSADGLFLEPVPIEPDTFYPRQIPATDTTSPKVQVDFQVATTYNDGDSKMIKKAEMDNHDLLEDNGLFDLNMVSSSPTTTQVTITVTTDFGTALNPTKVEGLETADFSVAEITPTPANVALSGSSETSPGVYDLFYASAQDGGDTQQATVTKTGFQVSKSDIYTT